MADTSSFLPQSLTQRIVGKMSVRTNQIAVVLVIVIVLAFVVPLVGDRGLSGAVLIVCSLFAFAAITLQMIKAESGQKWLAIALVVWLGVLIFAIVAVAGDDVDEKAFSSFVGVALGAACLFLIVAFLKTKRGTSEVIPIAGSSSGDLGDVWGLCNDMVFNGEFVQKVTMFLGAGLFVMAALSSTNHNRHFAFLATVAFTASVLSNNYTLWITVLAVAVLLVNALYIFLVDVAPSVGGTPKDSTRMTVLLNVVPAILIALVHFFMYSYFAKLVPGVSFQNFSEARKQQVRVEQLSEALTDMLAVLEHKFKMKPGEALVDDLQSQINSLFVVQGGDMKEIAGRAVEIFNTYAGYANIPTASSSIPVDILTRRIANLNAFLRNPGVVMEGESEAGGTTGAGAEAKVETKDSEAE